MRDEERQVDQQEEARWQPTRGQLLWAGGIAALVFLIIVFCGYLFGWKWTGLPKQTLWDWLDLLIVPVVLAIGGYLFTRSEDRRTREQADRFTRSENSRTLEQADHRREEDVLQAYLDQMWKLLLNKDLLRSTSKANSNSEALTAARVSTLTTLERIHHHPDKKGIIVKFLSECGLLEKQDTVVILEGANLSGANLTGVDLSDANLIGADLRGAYKVTGVETKQPITNEELVQQTKFLEGTTMPNGQKYEDWLKSKDQEQNKKSDGSS